MARPSAYVITLDREAMRGELAQDIVAHEIAHAWLDHTFGMEADQIEEEADEQMAAWGFKPKGRGET